MARHFESRVLDLSGGLRSGVSEYGRKCRHFTTAENVEFRPYGAVQMRKGSQKVVGSALAFEPHTIMEWVSSAGISFKFVVCDDTTSYGVLGGNYILETTPYTLSGLPLVWDQLDGTLWATEYGGGHELMTYRSSNPADTFISGTIPAPSAVCASNTGASGGNLTINAAYQYRLRWICANGGSPASTVLKVGVFPAIAATTAITAGGPIPVGTTVLNPVLAGDLSLTMSANATATGIYDLVIGGVTYPACKTTNGSPVVTLAQSKRTLTTLTVTTRTDYLYWILERTVGGGSEFFFLAQGTGADYIDNIADTGLGYKAEELNYGQLPNGHVDGVLALNDRLIGWQGSTVYLSQAIGGADGSGITNWNAENAYDFGAEDGDRITVCCKQADRVVVFKTRSIWALEGNDPANYRVVHLFTGAGAAGPRSAGFMGNAGWFHGDAGLHEMVGNTIRPFGYVEVGDVLATFAKTAFDRVLIRPHSAQRVLMAFSQSGTHNDTLLVYDQRYRTWQVWRNWYIADLLCPKFVDFGDQESFLFVDPRDRGAGEFYCYAGFFGYRDEAEPDGSAGSPVTFLLQTPWIDDGAPDVLKSLKRLQAYLRGTNLSVKVTVEVDPFAPPTTFVLTAADTAPLWGDGRLWGDGSLWASPVSDSGRTTGLPQGLFGRRYRLTFEGSADSEAVFKGFVIDGIVQPDRRASTV